MKDYSFNSVKNQKIKERFVDREVYACITDMAEYLFGYESDTYASWYEWDNLMITICPNCNACVNEDDWIYIEDLDPDLIDADSMEVMDGYQCPYCKQFVEEIPEPEQQEIMEYLIVSSFLGEKLLEKGEPVLRRNLGWIWGRTCTGQSVFLDGVISEICYELGILEDQPNEWAT